MKTYVAIVRDHSASMTPMRMAATDDYNKNIKQIQDECRRYNQQTYISVVKCGVPTSLYGRQSTVETEFSHRPVEAILPLRSVSYDTNGRSTPLFDSVGQAINLLRRVHDYNDKKVAFLVLVITDGEENDSQTYGPRDVHKLVDLIRELQSTDRWTFAFRTPQSGRRILTQLGIPNGNIQTWDTTEEGLEEVSGVQTAALSGYYAARSMGHTATKTFYTDITNLNSKTVERNLQDVSKQVELFYVSKSENDMQIKDFIERKTKKPYLQGRAFYQLTKKERVVQPDKVVIIRDKTKASGGIYAGAQARSLLGLSSSGNISIVPGDHGQWDIFVQSKSTNRKLKENTYCLVYPKAV